MSCRKVSQSDFSLWPGGSHPHSLSRSNITSNLRSRITPGVVRYLGPNDQVSGGPGPRLRQCFDQVGVELRERLGDCDGSVGGVRHFNW